MSFAKSLFTVSGLTILSRITGFIRDTMMAMFVGAGSLADSFFVAQRLPNMFRSLFAEGAFTAAFVPIYSAESEKNGTEAAQRFAGEALAILVSALTPFIALFMLLMPYIVLIIAPGFRNDLEKYEATISFSRIMFPYLMMISVTALQSGVLNARGNFGAPAAAPIIQNLLMILGLLFIWLFKLPAVLTLSWIFTLSGVVQALFLYASCQKIGLSIPLIRPHLSEASKKLFKLIGPGAIGAGAAQINVLISTILASTLPTGAISYLFYADRLNQLPIGIIGIAVSTTLLPILSRHEAKKDSAAVVHYTSRALEFSLLFGLPAAIGLALAAEPIIQTLFERGKFSHDDTVNTAQALMAYSLSVPALMLTKVFSSRFLARHDVKTPVKIALLSMVTNVICSLLLIGLLQHVGIALASAIANWSNAAHLYLRLRKRREKLADDKCMFRLPRLLISAAVMGIVTLAVVNLTSDWYKEGKITQEVMALTAIIGFSSLAYALLLQMTGALRWREALAIISRK